MRESSVLLQPKKAVSIVLVLGTLLFGIPDNANAQAGPMVPVTDYFNTLVNATLTEKEIALDVAGWLQKTLISQITVEMVNWINSDFDGQPGFVIDPFGEMREIAEEEAERFVNELEALPDAFEAEVKSTVTTYFRDSLEKKIKDSLPTSIDTPEEYDQFVSGDFSQGGWEAWAALRRPNNNQYSAFLNADAVLKQRVAQKQAIEKTVWDWGDGFRSVTDSVNGIIKTPGTIIQQQLNHVLGSNIRQLEHADEFNEIIGALAAYINRNLFTGVNGLAGLSESNDGTGLSFLDRLSDEANDLPNTLSAGEAVDGRVIDPDVAQPDNGTGSTTFFRGNITQNNGVITEQSGVNGDFRSDNAIDGQTDSYSGTDEKASSITAARAYPWWQIDLRGDYAIDIIRILPRPEVSASAAVGTYRVFVSDTPFPADAQTNPSRFTVGEDFDPTNPPSYVWASPNQQPGSDINNVFVNRRGRYVRIQRVDTGATGSARLQLAEVEVIQNEGPTIRLNGPATVTIDEGEDYDEQGATVTDTLDPNPTLEITGSVNENQAGSYTITYTATDSGGAVTVVTRTVNVVER